MDNKKIAMELSCLSSLCGDECSFDFKKCYCETYMEYEGAMEMAKYKDDFYKPLVDKMADFLESCQCEEIAEEIADDDGDWCEQNCNDNISCQEKCILKWLEVKNKQNKQNE